MRILVVGKGSRVLGWEEISAAMQPHGHEIIATSSTSDPLRGDVLMLLGLENWYLDVTSIALLERARAAGIPRILWQFEPLLPPGLPALTHAFITRSSGADASAKRPALIDNFVHGYRALKLLSAARRQSWGRSLISPHVFKYPIEQSRNVVSFWDQGLFEHIFVSLRPREAFLSELHIPSSFVPIGYTSTLGRSLEHGNRDIDVLFFGHVSSRRRALLGRVDAALRKAGYALKVIERDCYGDDRTVILNRSKIVLNLHKFPWEFAGQRLLMAMSCGALVVSEWAPDTTPYEHGEHLFTARIEELPQILVTLLQDPSRREAVAEAGYRFATTQQRIERILPAALERALRKHA